MKVPPEGVGERLEAECLQRPKHVALVDLAAALAPHLDARLGGYQGEELGAARLDRLDRVALDPLGLCSARSADSGGTRGGWWDERRDGRRRRRRTGPAWESCMTCRTCRALRGGSASFAVMLAMAGRLGHCAREPSADRHTSMYGGRFQRTTCAGPAGGRPRGGPPSRSRLRATDRRCRPTGPAAAGETAADAASHVVAISGGAARARCKPYQRGAKGQA